MISLTEEKIKIMNYMDKLSPLRDYFIEKNEYYYKDLVKFLRFNIPRGSNILEIGCGTGYLLASLMPARGVGIDISSGMLEIARSKYKNLEFIHMDVEDITLNAPKTKELVNIMGALNVGNKKAILVLPEYNDNVYLSTRNVPNLASTLLADINTYDIINADFLVLTENTAKIFADNEAAEA